MPWETDIPDVIAGQPITSTWGNAIRDSVIHTVATVAALPSTGISEGDTAWVTSVARFHVRRGSRWWTTRAGTINPAVTDSNALYAITATSIGLVEITTGRVDIAAVLGAASTLAWSGYRLVSATEITARGYRSAGAAWPNSIELARSQSCVVYYYVEGYAT